MFGIHMYTRYLLIMDETLQKRVLTFLRVIGWKTDDFAEQYLPDWPVSAVKSLLRGKKAREDVVHAVEWAAQELIKDVEQGIVRGSLGLTYLHLDTCTAKLIGNKLEITLFTGNEEQMRNDLRRVADFIALRPAQYKAR